MDFTGLEVKVSKLSPFDSIVPRQDFVIPEMTDRTKFVLQLAKQEAQRLNHDTIGTEHILIGLVKEGRSVTAKFLESRGIDLRTISRELLDFDTPTITLAAPPPAA